LERKQKLVKNAPQGGVWHPVSNAKETRSIGIGNVMPPTPKGETHEFYQTDRQVGAISGHPIGKSRGTACGWIIDQLLKFSTGFADKSNNRKNRVITATETGLAPVFSPDFP
jgi:hypothetical protein